MYEMKLLLKRFWPTLSVEYQHLFFNADFIHLLQNEVCTYFTLPSYAKSQSILVRDDGMGIVQSLQVKRYNSVGDLAKDYFKTLTTCFEIYGCVIDVLDRYDVVHSTKLAVIIRRSFSSGGKGFQVIEGRSIPDWKKFLCTPENKQGLVRFLGDYALKHYNEFALQDNDEIFMAEYFQNPETVKQF